MGLLVEEAVFVSSVKPLIIFDGKGSTIRRIQRTTSGDWRERFDLYKCEDVDRV